MVLLAGRAHDYAHTARPLLHALELTHHFDLEVTADAGAVPGRARVLIAASDEPLTADQAAKLEAFVRGGGGAMLLHGTLAAWSQLDLIAEMAGWRPSGPGRLTELVVRTIPGHPLTDRLAPELRLEDELLLAEGPPANATVLMRASWQFTDQVVAYERKHGEGRFVHIGLGHGSAAYESTDFQKLVHRAALFAAGLAPAPAVGVGLVGYGAIAQIHAAAITAVAGLDLRAVCDVSAERRLLAQKELGVEAHSVSTACSAIPTSAWWSSARHRACMRTRMVAALDAGKHAVCEKPSRSRWMTSTG
jgi:hypothetical protein